MEETRLLLGRRIKSLRKKIGISQEDIAEKTAISSKYISEIERGHTNLSIDIAEEISEVLGVDLPALLDCKHEQHRDILTQQLYSSILNAPDKEFQIIFKIVNYILK
ncbi:HTH domain-containing protein, Cro/C1-type [Desulfonema limicola]|uniref:HTH domain-containing protein, Cro/C1-type n=1 Tax=Desulfonema limicola TaxID=45656 RepID=A0A975B4V2_9BACT|nr:helix-turn-helix transcriptional regulator [Desulfonema limicola]QTA78816.1 HTH domain-containing protein, Cro/C1-type [Desulfonema limicola]